MVVWHRISVAWFRLYLSSSGMFAHGNGCGHSPSSLPCTVRRYDMMSATSLKVGQLWVQTDSVCTPPSYEGSFLSLASWLSCKRNPWTPALCIVRSVDRVPGHTSAGPIVGRTTQTCGLEDSAWLNSPLSRPCDRVGFWSVWAGGDRNRHTHLHARQAPFALMDAVERNCY